MRLFVAVMILASAPVVHREMAVPATSAGRTDTTAALYDPNPTHIWNRLYDALLIREGPTGTKYGGDLLDPLLWHDTKHLLTGASHEYALRILDQFLQTHAEHLIQDPAKRAILQRDLWAVFDWSAQNPDDEEGLGYEKERKELQIRLEEVLRRLALTSKQVESLPDNYAQAVASGAFAKEYDPAHKDQAFLPPDLLEPSGPWVLIGGNRSDPVAKEHVSEFSGRSRFLVFVRLPGGRKSTLDYFQTLWNNPQPWTSLIPASDEVIVNPDLPQFPAGTQVAMVRQMTLFDDQGNLVPAPITESVQIRIYRAITASKENHYESEDFEELSTRSGQAFYEFTLSRAQLFANKTGGLRAMARDEREFSARADDPFEPLAKNLIPLRLRTEPIFRECAICHSAGGINSLESRSQLLKPNPPQHDVAGRTNQARWWEYDETINWKRDRYDWGLLTGYWRSSRLH